VSTRVNVVRNDDPACAEPVVRAGAAGERLTCFAIGNLT
jgi:hypothetical protein